MRAGFSSKHKAQQQVRSPQGSVSHKAALQSALWRSGIFSKPLSFIYVFHIISRQGALRNGQYAGPDLHENLIYQSPERGATLRVYTTLQGTTTHA